MVVVPVVRSGILPISPVYEIIPTTPLVAGCLFIETTVALFSLPDRSHYDGVLLMTDLRLNRLNK